MKMPIAVPGKRKKWRLLWGVLSAGVLVLAAGTPARADTITLTLTIRDFMFSHPQFGNFVFGDDHGIVAPALGLDHKPVYGPGPLGATWSTPAGNGFTAKENFDQWYNDTPGINMTTTKDIVLTKQVDGYYHYDNASFFPIDGELFGNEGWPHNFNFTAEYHGQFVYQAGQQFSFASDDDTFVFINNSLALDMGGVHPAELKTVNLDTLGLTAGNTYAFDFFYAERCPSGAVMTMWGPQLTPEPATMALMGVGGLAMAAIRRRKMRK